MSTVLVISGAWAPMRAGEAEHALYLCRHLASSGAHVHVLTGTDGAATGAEPFTLHPVMHNWGWRDLPRFVSVLRRVRPDAVLCIYSAWIYHYLPMMTYAPTVVHRLRGCPFVTQFEHVDGTRRWGTRLTRLLASPVRLWASQQGRDPFYGTLLRDSDAVIVLTPEYRDMLTRHSAKMADKTIIIPPSPLLHMAPADEAARRETRAAWGVRDTDFVLAFFGYAYPGKGIDTLLHALKRLEQTRPQAKLVLIGGDVSGYESYAQEMQTLAGELGIGDKVVWTGRYASDSDAPSRALRASDACILPFEQGVTLNRSSFAAAAAHGLPTVTTKGAHIDPAFRDGENVLLCPPCDPDALAACLETLIASPELCARLRAGIMEMAQEWFSWERAIARTRAALGLSEPLP